MVTIRRPRFAIVRIDGALHLGEVVHAHDDPRVILKACRSAKRRGRAQCVVDDAVYRAFLAQPAPAEKEADSPSA